MPWKQLKVELVRKPTAKKVEYQDNTQYQNDLEVAAGAVGYQ